MTWREDYAKEAYHDGKATYRAGNGTNPHPTGSFEHTAWTSGWSSAQAEKHQISQLKILHPPVRRPQHN